MLHNCAQKAVQRFSRCKALCNWAAQTRPSYTDGRQLADTDNTMQLKHSVNIASSETLPNNDLHLLWSEIEAKWAVSLNCECFSLGSDWSQFLLPAQVWLDTFMFKPGDMEDKIKKSTGHIVCLVQIFCGHLESSGAVGMILQSKGSSLLPLSFQTILAVPDCTSKRQGHKTLGLCFTQAAENKAYIVVAHWERLFWGDLCSALCFQQRLYRTIVKTLDILKTNVIMPWVVPQPQIQKHIGR